jgi:hypothetical protein
MTTAANPTIADLIVADLSAADLTVDRSRLVPSLRSRMAQTVDPDPDLGGTGGASRRADLH